MQSTLDLDPLEEEHDRHGPCDCEHGWLYVSPRYAEHLATVSLPDGSTEVDEQRRQALVNSVYPCRDCKPGLFFRWVGKHLDPQHDASDCRECTGAHGSKSAPARDLPRPPERRDID